MIVIKERFGVDQAFDGTEQEIVSAIRSEYPFLRSCLDLDSITNKLKSTYGFDISRDQSILIKSLVFEDPAVDASLCNDFSIKLLIQAVSSISGPIDLNEVKILLQNHSPVDAVLLAAKLTPDQKNKDLLESILSQIQKSEITVLSPDQESMECCKDVSVAIDSGKYKTLKEIFVVFGESNWLLKPLNKKELAFSRTSKEWGLAIAPSCFQLSINDRPYLAIKLPKGRYKSFVEEQNTKRLLIQNFLNLDVYKWAVLDYVFGNNSRHRSTAIFQGEDILFMDNSCLGGPKIVPFYIQAFTPDLDDKVERLKMAPRVPESSQKILLEWIDSLSVDRLGAILFDLGLDAGPVDKLKELKRICEDVPSDLAVMSQLLM